MIGCDYVGLVTGTCLVELGHAVACTDNDSSKIEALRAGKLPIYEPHLDALIERNLRDGRLQFLVSPAEAVRLSETVFICVGTATLRNSDADLSAIDRVAQMVASVGGGPKLIVEKSTVPAQTGQNLQRALEVYTRKSGVKFRVASNPEFLRESTSVSDFFHPDRIVIGVDEPGDAKQLEEIYGPIVNRKFRSPRTVEVVPNMRHQNS